MKYVIFLGDGMADEPIDSLGGRTPLMAADTPNLDHLARSGHARFGTFLSLPQGFPTSSDVANMSVLGYDLKESYQGRGPLEAASLGIVLRPNEIAMRCNLVTASDDLRLLDYSGGQIRTEEAIQLIAALQEAFGEENIQFKAGVSYRNLLFLNGPQYSADFAYEKPDDHPGEMYMDLLPQARGPESEMTAELLQRIMLESIAVLDSHPVNRARKARDETPANMAWFWSPGRKPNIPAFQQRYGKSGAIISAVGVINGIGTLTEMEIIKVPGATGYIDTNYEGKARAGVEALQCHDFVFVHVEAIDEVSHAGNLDLKLKAIEDFDKRLVGTFLKEYGKIDDLSCAVLPDHPVPVKLRKHTRIPVPVMFFHPDQSGDEGDLLYNEIDAAKGSIGLLEKDGVMRTLFQQAIDTNSK